MLMFVGIEPKLKHVFEGITNCLYVCTTAGCAVASFPIAVMKLGSWEGGATLDSKFPDPTGVGGAGIFAFLSWPLIVSTDNETKRYTQLYSNILQHSK